MISFKTLTTELQEKLNSNIEGLTFRIVPDTGTRKKPVRVGNTVTDAINGVFSLISSDLSNLVDGTIFATISCRLRVILRLQGGVDDEDETITDPDSGRIQVRLGNNTIIENVRSVLAEKFLHNEQRVMTDSDGKQYIVSIMYNFAQTGERNQVEGLGDSFSFSAYVSYMFVENGINTNDIEYYLDGNRIPFQLSTIYRNPTMNGNVYGDTVHGEARNISSQSVFEASFNLPAVTNEVTEAMFEWLFDGGLNTLHILRVHKVATDVINDKFYLVTFAEYKLLGETIKNQNQDVSLVEIIDDYELVTIPTKYYIYTPNYTTLGNTVTADFTKITENKSEMGGTTSKWVISQSDLEDVIRVGDTVTATPANIPAQVIKVENDGVTLFYTGSAASSPFYATAVNGTLTNVSLTYQGIEFNENANFYLFTLKRAEYGKYPRPSISTVSADEILICTEPLIERAAAFWDEVRAGVQNG